MWSSFNLDCINCINCPLYAGLQILYLYLVAVCHRLGRGELRLTAASHLYLSWPPVTSIMLVTNCGFISQILIISFYSPAQHCLCLRWSFTFRPTDINLRGQEQVISRFRMVKIWFPQNAFFILFFSGRTFILVYYIIKLVLEFQFDLQNPLKLPKMRIFEKWKIIVFG